MAASESEVKVTSAPVLTGEISAEERKKRLDDIRNRMNRRLLDVKAPRGWKTYWARVADERDIARLEFKGYRVVRESPAGPRRYDCSVKCREDGTYVVGDVILMEVEEEIWEFLRQNEKEKGDIMLKGATEQFIEDTLAQGVPVLERDEHNNITRKHSPNRR